MICKTGFYKRFFYTNFRNVSNSYTVRVQATTVSETVENCSKCCQNECKKPIGKPCFRTKQNYVTNTSFIKQLRHERHEEEQECERTLAYSILGWQ